MQKLNTKRYIATTCTNNIYVCLLHQNNLAFELLNLNKFIVNQTLVPSIFQQVKVLKVFSMNEICILFLFCISWKKKRTDVKLTKKKSHILFIASFPLTAFHSRKFLLIYPLNFGRLYFCVSMIFVRVHASTAILNKFTATIIFFWKVNLFSDVVMQKWHT